MPRIKARTTTLEARIAAAEIRVPDQAMPASMLEAYQRAANVLLCFCERRDTAPGDIRSCLLQRGFSGEDAERYAGMAYSEARDEVMAAPALVFTSSGTVGSTE